MNDLKVVIGLPTMEMARQAKFYDYLNQLERPLGTLLSCSHGQSPAMNRNIIIKQALEVDATHIFFIDDDVCIPRDALLKLLAHNKDIVSGLYLHRNYPHAPIAFNVAYNDGRCRYKFLENGDNGLVEIVNAGLGCALIRTEVFRTLGTENWIRLGQLNSQEWNDDIDFFNRCRAAGFKMYLDQTVCCGHMATATIWPEYKDGKWLTVYDTQGGGHAAFWAATPKQIYGDDTYERSLKEFREQGRVEKATV